MRGTPTSYQRCYFENKTNKIYENVCFNKDNKYINIIPCL